MLFEAQSLGALSFVNTALLEIEGRRGVASLRRTKKKERMENENEK